MNMGDLGAVVTEYLDSTEPKPGDRRRRIYNRPNHPTFEVWVICTNCGEGRWIQDGTRKQPYWTGLCLACCNRSRSTALKLSNTGKHRLDMVGANHRGWKGRRLTMHGYVKVHVWADDPYFRMTQAYNRNSHGGECMEHRLVMAQHMGRCLEPWEVVHHINGIKSDNRIENLQLLGSDLEHQPSVITEGQIKKYRRQLDRLIIQNGKLRAENRALRIQICRTSGASASLRLKNL